MKASWPPAQIGFFVIFCFLANVLFSVPLQAWDCLLLGCISDQQYHKVTTDQKGSFKNEKGKDYVSQEAMLVGPHGWTVRDPKVDRKRPNEREVKFYRAYLEVKESGKLFSSLQLKAIKKKIEEIKSSTRPLYAVIYIHGWHYNADDNVDLSDPKSLNVHTVKFKYFAARYKEQTRRLFELNGEKDSPEVLAIYVGWRGESTNAWLDTYLTIGERAEVADDIGKASGKNTLRDALKDISESVADSGVDSRTLIVGHSLGGRMLSRMVLGDIADGKLQPFGPKVLFSAIQPAIGADCYRRIFGKSLPTMGSKDAPPSFIALTSTDDPALSDYYTAGAALGVIEKCDDDSESRKYAIGDYTPYITHKYSFDYIDPKRADYKKALGEALKNPSVDDVPTWLYKTSDKTKKKTNDQPNEFTTVWSYPRYKNPLKVDDNANPRTNYDLKDLMTYTLTIEEGSKFSKAGAVWNIATDRNLIDVSENAKHTEAGTMQALHNAIASTGVADILSRIVYAQRVWLRDYVDPTPTDAAALPKKSAADDLPIVPKPTKSELPKESATK
jgi:hypothetical protein